jgi:hypothetical protein
MFCDCSRLLGFVIYIFLMNLGQQARDALLLIMQLSHRNPHIARHIVENTNFCPVR